MKKGVPTAVVFSRGISMASTDTFSSPEDPESANVLVVDDEEPIRRLMERMLRQCGYSIVHAGSGEEALSVCERRGGVLRLVVTDITMPGMNGFDLAEHIAERWPGVKILFITGLRNDCGIRRKLCDRPILEKPFTGEDFTKTVRALLTETASGN